MHLPQSCLPQFKIRGGGEKKAFRQRYREQQHLEAGRSTLGAAGTEGGRWLPLWQSCGAESSDVPPVQSGLKSWLTHDYTAEQQLDIWLHLDGHLIDIWNLKWPSPSLRTCTSHSFGGMTTPVFQLLRKKSWHLPFSVYLISHSTHQLNTMDSTLVLYPESDHASPSKPPLLWSKPSSSSKPNNQESPSCSSCWFGPSPHNLLT